MSYEPVVPAVKEEASRSELNPNAPMKKTVVRTKATKKPARKKPINVVHRKVGRSSPNRMPTKSTATKRQRKPFPYARVLKMWEAGKSSMAIAKSVGRYDSKATDPMHSFRVTLTRFHKGVRIDGKLVKLPHRVSKKALRRATKAGKKAAA